MSSLYDLHFSLIDLEYPGASGYNVRSVHNPFGDGKNVILVGGSDATGVGRATDVFLEELAAAEGDAGHLSVGWLMEIALGEGLVVPDKLEDVEIWEASVASGSSGFFGWNIISKRMALYYMTGDAFHAQEFLRLAFPDEQAMKELIADGEKTENKDDPLAGPYHYTAHMLILFWDLIEESPIFSDAERLKVTNAFSRQLEHRRDEGIYKQHNQVPVAVGDRHAAWSATSLYALARYFSKEYEDSVWDYALRGCVNHFGSLHEYAYVDLEHGHQEWHITNLAPIVTYLLLSSDRVPVEHGSFGELIKEQEIIVSGRVPDWSLESASIGMLNTVAYLTGQGQWLRYRERTGIDTGIFRLGQSFWPHETLAPSEPEDLVNRWTIRRLSYAEWADRQDGLPYILVKGLFQGTRVPYHTFSLMELRMNGITILKGHRNQVLAFSDGMVEPVVATNATLKHSDVTGATAALVATTHIQASQGNTRGPGVDAKVDRNS